MRGKRFVTAGAAPAPDNGRLLDEAIAAGKFPASRRAHYAAMLDRDPARTRALIAVMAAVPEAGLSPAAAGRPEGAGPEGYPAHWLGATLRQPRAVITHGHD